MPEEGGQADPGSRLHARQPGNEIAGGSPQDWGRSVEESTNDCVNAPTDVHGDAH
jgi:hypothetical protein